MSEWLIMFETVIGVIVVIIALGQWFAHREKLAEMQIEAWRETLTLPPISMFNRPGVQPVPIIVGQRGENLKFKAKLARDASGDKPMVEDEPAGMDASDTADAEEDQARGGRG